MRLTLRQRLAAGAACFFAGWALAGSQVHAQAIDAGDYVPAPAGTQLGLIYTQFATSSDLYANGRKISNNADLTTAISIFRYVGFTKVAGMILDYQVLVPYGYVAAGGSVKALGNTSGLADTILVSTLWLHNDPAHASYFGITPYLYLPTGDYDAKRALNLGEHRWKGSLQAVWSKGLTKNIIGEIAGDAMIFGDNDRYLGSQSLKQSATYRVQLFARYLINQTNEANLRLMYVTGGDQHVEGLDSENRAETLSALATWRHNLAPRWQLLSQFGTDLSVRSGFREGPRLQFRLLRVFK